MPACLAPVHTDEARDQHHDGEHARDGLERGEGLRCGPDRGDTPVDRGRERDGTVLEEVHPVEMPLGSEQGIRAARGRIRHGES
jgi:hypothetical protein